ncbi:MAG: hypothetical protein PHE12_03005, partial [Clostridia bacterium]|nr:hypothetical protein [Clostridia bacterium]
RQEDDDSEPQPLQFENITASDWTEYQFYVQTGELSKGFALEIWNGTRDGDSDNLSQGIVLYDDAKMSTITEESFEQDFTEEYISKFVFKGLDFAPEETPEPTPEPTPTPEPEEEDVPFVFPWGLVTTSLIAFVLLFVMVLLFIRKLKSSKVFKAKTPKVKAPSYSRDKIKTVKGKDKGKRIRVKNEHQPETESDNTDEYDRYDTIDFEKENQEMQEMIDKSQDDDISEDDN